MLVLISSSRYLYSTDKYIQTAIRNDFHDKTVITIAHRLNTVIDFDKIVVMDNGVVAEYGTPQQLINSPTSLFSGFVDQTGVNNAILLRQLANQ